MLNGPNEASWPTEMLDRLASLPWLRAHAARRRRVLCRAHLQSVDSGPLAASEGFSTSKMSGAGG